jgi:FKBP-type peptidyl-prolyl cis-trans isomerase
MKRVLPMVLVLLLPLLVSAGKKKAPHPDNSKPTPVPKYVSMPSGVEFYDIKEGTGKEVVMGSQVLVNYTGWLTDGRKFDSSYDRGEPLPVTVGQGVIRGWSEGLQGMKAGGKRQLKIPADLGYGPRGAPPMIPPNATLIFDVELLEVK